jgi:TetR/AcrR family fatty acid metabolism transcriptional regulator
VAARIVDKDAKKTAIQKAALKVFARTGLNKFKMAEIAVEAGVGKGTLYEYFPSKEHLIMGSITQFMTDFETFVASEIEAAKDPVEKIEKLIESSVHFCLVNQDRVDAVFDLYSAGIPRTGGGPALIDLGPRYKELIRYVAAIIEDGIEQGAFKPVDSEFVASMIMAMLDGLFFQAAVGAISMEPEDISRKAIEALLKGLISGQNNESK